MLAKCRQEGGGRQPWPHPAPHDEDATTEGSSASVTLAASIRQARLEAFEQRTGRSLVFKMGHLIALAGRKLVRVEPMDRSKRQVGAQVLSHTNLSPDAVYPRWSLVNLVLVVLSMLHVAFNLYHQYKLDFNLVQVNQLLRAHRHDYGRNKSSNSSVSSAIEELQTIVRHHHGLLTATGAPGTHLSFAIEVLYWIQIIVPAIPYLLPQLYVPPIRDYNLYAASMLHDYEHHLVVCQLHIQEQVGRFLGSSHNFRRILASKHSRFRGSRSPATALDLANRGANNLAGEPPKTASLLAMTRMMMSSFDLELELARLAAGDKLMPANSSPQQILTWMPALILFMAFCIVYGLAFDLYFVYTLFFSTELSTPPAPPIGSPEWQPEQASSPAAYRALTGLESLFLLAQLNLSATYQGCTFLATVLDMKTSANQLRARVDNFVRAHDQRLLVDCEHHQIAAAARSARNVQLLELFMHYRVFLRQFKAQQQYYTCTMWTCVSTAMTVPLVARLHVPYFEANEAAKTFFIGLSLFIVTPATWFLVPPCSLHRRCQDLTKSLLYLCAHIARTGQLQQAAPGGGGGGGNGNLINRCRRQPVVVPHYDEHLVSALRRELGLNRCESRDQFTIPLGLATISYTSLLEFYFWFGLVVVSIVARSSSNLGVGGDHSHQSFGGLFNDPFGLYG